MEASSQTKKTGGRAAIIERGTFGRIVVDRGEYPKSLGGTRRCCQNQRRNRVRGPPDHVKFLREEG